MTRCQNKTISISVADNNLINNVFDLAAILTNNTNKTNAVSNKLLDQRIETLLISLVTVQHDFLGVWHEA